MSEFICVQVGQCGNQIGSAFWPLALHEYGIETSSGGVNQLKFQKDHKKNIDDLADAFHSFFYVPDNSGKFSFKRISDLNSAKVKARAVLIDMEDSVVSRYKQGPLRNLFDQTCTVTNYPGSGNNWAVGYYTHGRNYHDKLEETIRKTAERCDSLHGFLLTHSLGGGTGSGLGTATLSLLADEYPHVDKFLSSVHPAAAQDVITAPYNVLLASKELIDHATCVFPADNGALLDICNSQICKKDNVDQLNYNVTSTNLVPYPQLHYIFSSVSPISMTAPKLTITKKTKVQDELFMNAWSRSHQLIKLDPLNPKSVIISAGHIARGNCSMDDMIRNIQRFQNKAKFTPWSKEVMKIGLCNVPPAGHPASLLCLLNSTSMRLMLKNIINQFDKLYQRKAHVHHYLEVDGFEAEHFDEAKESIKVVCDRYREVERQMPHNISRLKVK
ncbi:Similar to Tube1: Tubulin epsilon chain (Mus musculus) [Cotesia congregata]|uniref:Similar to Tube1: Tubulin epsilon chain (Mus musculus) n=1 Tax=Cotesia congregata TaxID=51543 RepID=A0A8J2H976_COTCN|nr:Similar to Tube1: Tubulin epsilon chain (Mus musculus) [Cotesia congregata]